MIRNTKAIEEDDRQILNGFGKAYGTTCYWALIEIENRYQIKFLEIGTDKDNVHFLVQSVPTYSVTKIVTMIKSISAREVFRRCPKVKKLLWGGEMWTDGYYAGTLGKHGNEDMIGKYVKGQGGTYQKLYSDDQLSLF